MAAGAKAVGDAASGGYHGAKESYYQSATEGNAAAGKENLKQATSDSAKHKHRELEENLKASEADANYELQCVLSF